MYHFKESVFLINYLLRFVKKINYFGINTFSAELLKPIYLVVNYCISTFIKKKNNEADKAK